MKKIRLAALVVVLAAAWGAALAGVSTGAAACNDTISGASGVSGSSGASGCVTVTTVPVTTSTVLAVTTTTAVVTTTTVAPATTTTLANQWASSTTTPAPGAGASVARSPEVTPATPVNRLPAFTG